MHLKPFGFYKANDMVRAGNERLCALVGFVTSLGNENLVMGRSSKDFKADILRKNGTMSTAHHDKFYSNGNIELA